MTKKRVKWVVLGSTQGLFSYSSDIPFELNEYRTISFQQKLCFFLSKYFSWTNSYCLCFIFFCYASCQTVWNSWHCLLHIHAASMTCLAICFLDVYDILVKSWTNPHPQTYQTLQVPAPVLWKIRHSHAQSNAANTVKCWHNDDLKILDKIPHVQWITDNRSIVMRSSLKLITTLECIKYIPASCTFLPR